MNEPLEGYSVHYIEVDADHRQQRIDNFLFSRLKGLPKSRIYKALRTGEIRVNKKRTKPDYKLHEGDRIRVPPLRVAKPLNVSLPGHRLQAIVRKAIIYEDHDFLILNKPAGIAVHGGSGIVFGVIEILRASFPKLKFLELVHRLDRETSGCLLLAKKSSMLREVHGLLTARKVHKTYWLLVTGKCDFKQKTVNVALRKNVLKSGERIVTVDLEGKPAKTLFKRLKILPNMTLLEAKPITGRTHQIRVHAAYIGHPIIGDEKYGNEAANKNAKAIGIKQLCLHSAALEFTLESKALAVGICAVLQEPWAKYAS
jgi:23S rRNA pseudouridine955/2504/2580 synthase